MDAYYMILPDKSRIGPLTASQLLQKGMTPESPVWHEGLADWCAAKEVPALASLLANPSRAVRSSVVFVDEDAAVSNPESGDIDEPEEQPSASSRIIFPSVVTIIEACVPWILFMLFYDSISSNVMFGGINQIYEANIFWPITFAGVYMFCVLFGLMAILSAARADRCEALGLNAKARKSRGKISAWLFFSAIFCLASLFIMLFPIILD